MIWWTLTHLGWDSCQACLMTSLHFSLPSCLLLPSRHTCILTFLWLQLWTAHNTMCNTPSWIDHGCRLKKSSSLLMQYGFHPLDLQDLLEATLKKKDVLFITGDWNAKVGSQEIPVEPGKFGFAVQNEGQWLTDYCQENTLLIANTLFQQHKTSLYTWTSSDGQYWNQIDYILCSQSWRSSIHSAKTRPGADCGSDHQLLITKFRLKWKKVGKAIRQFKYDLNQIPYDYTLEVMNWFKGSDLVDRVPENYGWRSITWYRSQWSRPSPRKRNEKRQSGCLRRPVK